MSNSNWPDGLSAEFVKVGLLRDGYLRDKSDSNLEHVTTFARENAKNKAFGNQVTSLVFKEKLRVTVDTEEDFKRVSKLFEKHSPAACFSSILDSVEG